MHLLLAEIQRLCTRMWRVQGRLRNHLTLASSEGASPLEIQVLVVRGQYLGG